MDSTSGRRSATDLDQLRWTAEARIPVALRHVDSSTAPMSVALGSCTYHSCRQRYARYYVGKEVAT